MRGRLVLVVLLVALLAHPSGAAAATTGEQRVLLMLTTWGPEPYAPATIRSELDEAAAYIRSVSFGRTWLVGEVTPWLHVLSAEPSCNTDAIAAAAQSAATAAGYQLSRYTTLGIAVPRLRACPWGGAYYPPGIWLNGRNDRQVIVHELGHTYGLPEEGYAWVCDPRCRAQPYLTPFSVMGHGQGDFSAWEKHAFGWLDRLAGPAPRVTLGAIDRPGPHPQGLQVVVSGDEYWFEYRPPAPVWANEADDADPGIAVYAGPNSLLEVSRFTARNALVYDPVGSGRTSVQAGETFTVGGVFAVQALSAGADSAELAFRWTDRTRPAKPILLPLKPRKGRVAIRWRRGLERGSGVAAHEVFVDGRRVGRVHSVRPVAGLLIRNEDRLTVRLGRGTHRIRVVAVDRAGNRSKPGTRKLRL